MEGLHGGDVADDVADDHEVGVVDPPNHRQQLAASH